MADERVHPVDEVELLRAAACDWRLSRGDVGVLAVILQHCNSDLEAYPGPARIAKLARLSTTQVKGCIKRLEMFRYLEVIRPGLRRKNRFKVLESPPVMPRIAVGQWMETRRNLGKRPYPVTGKGVFQARQMDRPSTRQVQRHQLGKSARQEVAFKSPKKSLGLTSSLEEQKRVSRDSPSPAYLPGKLSPLNRDD